jgi:hypothetical protein
MTTGTSSTDSLLQEVISRWNDQSLDGLWDHVESDTPAPSPQPGFQTKLQDMIRSWIDYAVQHFGLSQTEADRYLAFLDHLESDKSPAPHAAPSFNENFERQISQFVSAMASQGWDNPNLDLTTQSQTPANGIFHCALARSWHSK